MKLKLFEHFGLKLFAIIMGLLLWFHVATEKTYKHQINLPIAEISLSDDLSIASELPDSLTVIVNATGKQLLRKKWRSRGLRINATQFHAGRHNLTLNTQNTSLSSGEDLVSLEEIIFPTSIQLNIDFKLKKIIYVLPDINTIPDDGFAVSEINISEPNEITISGPRSIIKNIHSVTTEPKKLTSLRNDISLTLAILRPGNGNVTLDPDSVEVNIKVVPVKTRVFEAIPIVIFNSPSTTGFRTVPEFIKIELTGPPEEITNMSSNNIIASVDYLTADSISLIAAVKVECPARFQIKSISSDSIKIIEQ